MPQRVEERWQTVFGEWVSDVTVPRLVKSLSAAGQPVTAFAVHKWIAGDRTPRHDRVAAMVQLSDGRVCANDVYEHRELVHRVCADRVRR